MIQSIPSTRAEAFPNNNSNYEANASCVLSIHEPTKNGVSRSTNTVEGFSRASTKHGETKTE